MAKFKFDVAAPPEAPKESVPAKLWRMATAPIAETIGAKDALDKFAQPGLHDSKGKAMLKGFLSGSAGAVTPGTLAEIATLPAMAAEVPVTSSLSLLHKALGVRKLAQAAESIPATIQAASALGSGAQTVKSGIDAVKDVGDKDKSKANVAMDLLNVGLGSLGVRSGIKGYQSAAKVSRAMGSAAAASKTSGQQGLRVAVKELSNKPLGTDVLGEGTSAHDAARIAKMFPNGQPATAPTTAEEIAQHAAIREDLKKNPGGNVAKAIFGEEGVPKGYFSSEEAGAPKEFSDLPTTEYDKSLEAAQKARLTEAESFTKANNNAAASDLKLQVDSEADAAKAAKDKVAELNAGFKANADATSGLAKAEQTAQKAKAKDDVQQARNLNARDKFVEKSNTQEARNRTQAEKYVQKYNEQQARNANATEKYKTNVEKAENKATADQIAQREKDAVQEARNRNAADKYRRNVEVAQANAEAEDAKRTAAGIEQSDAERQANTLEDLRDTLSVQHDPNSISETISGPGDHGGTERATFRRTAPEPEEGEDGVGGAMGGGPSKPQGPTLLHYSRASAVKEGNRLGGPEKWDIVEPRKGVFKLTPHIEAGVAAKPEDLADLGLDSPPPAGSPAPKPKGPAPKPAPAAPENPRGGGAPSDSPVNTMSDSERDSLFLRNMSKVEADILGKHLGLEVSEVGPRKWRVMRPKGMESPDISGPSAPIEPSGPSTTFMGKKADEVVPKQTQFQPRSPAQQRDMDAMQARHDAQRASVGLPPQKLQDGTLSADVTDFEGGDTPTLDVPPPSNGPEEPPALAPTPSNPPKGPLPSGGGEVAPEGPEFDAFKKEYEDSYSKLLSHEPGTPEATQNANDMAALYERNPKWAEHIENTAPPEAHEPKIPAPPKVGLKSAKFEEAGNNDLESLLEDAHGADVNPDDLKLNAVGKGEAPAEPEMSVNDFASALSKEGNKPIVPVNMPNSPVQTGLHGPAAESGNLFGDEAPKGPPDLFNQPAEPELPPVPPAMAEGGAIPARMFKSPLEAAGENYGAIKSAKKAGEAVPEEGRRVAAQAAQRLNKTSQAPQAPEPVPAPPAQANPEAQGVIDMVNDPQTEPILRERLKAWLRNSGIKFMPGDDGGGGTTLSSLGAGQFGNFKSAAGGTGGLVTRLASATIGGATGAELDPLDNKEGSMAAGAGVGFFAPELAGSVARLGKASDTFLGNSRGKIAEGAKFVNQLHNSALLSPLSAGKKLGGDIGGVTLAALEHPDRRGAILQQLLTQEGRANLSNAFKEGYNGPAQESTGGLDLSGKLNSKLNPLGVSGRMMSGLTTATKGLLGEAGFSAPEQRYYTLTDHPRYDATGKLYNAIRNNEFTKHFIPFARVGINRLERGYEYSPFGYVGNKMMAKYANDPTIGPKAAIGTAAGIASYAATPENFVKDHPIVASSAAALGGPLGLPILTGMALKNSHRQPNDPYHMLPDTSKLSDATGEIARDIPGLRLIEDASGKNPTGFARNYLSGYTNFLRPVALGKQLLEEGNTDDPDLSSKDLSNSEKLMNRALSNVPFVRETLPKKKVSITGTPKFKFNF